MNYKLSMVTLLLLNTLNANILDTKLNENNNTVKKDIFGNENHESDASENDIGYDDPETKALQLKEKKLSLNNTLIEEKLKSEHTDLLTKLQKLRWEKELLLEEYELKELESKNKRYEVQQKQEERIEELEYLARVKSLEMEKLTTKMALERGKWDLNISKLQSEIDVFESSKKREKYLNVKPQYLDNPLTKDNKLVITDRRVVIDGVIRSSMAEEITSKINYFNNKDKTKPIFLVINHSNGGTAMAGYLILKAMKASEAPIYVVLREYAASMAAIIVTLAERSYAYSHASIMHHQPINGIQGNLREHEENQVLLEKWWSEFGGATAEKMGITLEEFRKKMYEHNSRGNWEELAVDAQKLKWVNHIIDTIVDTAIVEEPKKRESNLAKLLSALDFQETINEKGKSVVYLPPVANGDAYFLHNSGNYYQFR